MEGTKCDFPECNVCDFLPFTCIECKKVFCLTHRSVFIHNCERQQTIQQQNELKELNEEKQISVKEMFHQIEHRFDNEPIYEVTEHYKLQSSEIETDKRTEGTMTRIERLNDIQNSSTTELKNKNIANKTKQILIKNRAIGNDTIQSENRLYFEIHFVASGEMKFLFFAKYQTVGEVLEYLAAKFTLLSYQTPVRPDNLSLTFIESTSQQQQTLSIEELRNHLNQLRRDVPISETFQEFSSLDVHVVPIELVVEAQRYQQSQTQPQQLSENDSNLKMDESSSTSTTTITSSSPSLPLPPREYRLGDSIEYLPSSEDNSRWVGVIAAVHRDDVTPYYTVRLINTVTFQTKEKQTTSTNLISSDTSTTSSSDSSAFFSVKISFQSKSYVNPTIPREGTVFDLKLCLIQMSPLIANGVNIFNMKLIYKGKTLKTNDMKLRGKELNIVDNGTIMLLIQQENTR